MIPLSKPGLGKNELEAVNQTFKSNWIAGQGPMNTKLEQKFSKYIGARYAVCVNNCTSALHLALLALNIKPGDEVIVPDYTFPATAHAVKYVGATPVFADVSLFTMCIAPGFIRPKITKRTKAIIVVHPFGIPCDMKPIMKLAREYKIKVIEDCACAVGAEDNGRKVGTFGDVNCFSFHARKILTSGEGGIVTTNNKRIAQKVRSLACFGMDSAYNRSKHFKVPLFKELGYNYKLSDINASIALSQLEVLPDIIEKRVKLAKYYIKKLQPLIPNITLPILTYKDVNVFQSFIIYLIKHKAVTIIPKLREQGIQVNIGTYALHRQPVYGKVIDDRRYSNTSILMDYSIALPFYTDMTTKEVDTVVATLRRVLRC